jgi:acrylyl-CoA reductase (NADPH)
MVKNISTNLVALEEDDLMSGDVTVAVDYSTVNCKDGLALTGPTSIIQTFPLSSGIGLAGTVQASCTWVSKWR